MGLEWGTRLVCSVYEILGLMLGTPKTKQPKLPSSVHTICLYLRRMF